jgi:hypothetical protein
MPGITAIELGADTCAFVRASVRGSEMRVTGVEILDPASFAGIDSFTNAIKQVRRTLRLPRRARAVVWGLPDGASRRDPEVRPLIEPLTGAGFRVESVVSPCNALAALARLRMPRPEAATCWLAVNRGGVAIVAVRPGKQLYSHSFIWDSSIGSTGSQARLLQRYSLVSYLAPEVKRAMTAARQKGTPIEAIVTCGNLPDLRSLTMPLIEELDVEVETLDSLEGLVVKPDLADRLSETAAAIRIACAGAIARPTRARNEAFAGGLKRGRLLTAAAIVAAVFAGGWFLYAGMFAPRPAPVTTPPRVVAPPKNARPQTPLPARQIPTPPPARQTPAAPPVAVQKTAPPPPQTTPAQKAPAPVTVAAPPKTTLPTPPATIPKNPAPAAPVVAKAAPQPMPQAKPPAATPPAPKSAPRVTQTTPQTSIPVASAPRIPAAPPRRETPKTETPRTEPLKIEPPKIEPAPAREAPPRVAPPTAPLNPAPSAADRNDAAKAAQNKPLPPLLKDPLPRVTAILVANDRRFATIDEGHIITIGDVIGRRVVVGIDERAVVLREPSGVQIRVALGGRLEGIDRSGR